MMCEEFNLSRAVEENIVICKLISPGFSDSEVDTMRTSELLQPRLQPLEVFF